MATQVEKVVASFKRSASSLRYRAAASKGTGSFLQKRNFSSSSHDHEDEYETEKWKKITYVGIVTRTVLAIYKLSKGHPHYEEPPPYPYLHIRNKDFPRAKQLCSVFISLGLFPTAVSLVRVSVLMVFSRRSTWIIEAFLSDLICLSDCK